MIASLDGPTAEVNDRVRGAGNHEAARSVIGHLQTAGLNPVINVVPTTVNVGYLTELAELADRLSVARMQVTPPLDRGFPRLARGLWPPADALSHESAGRATWWPWTTPAESIPASAPSTTPTRETSLATTWRQAPVFRWLRDATFQVGRWKLADPPSVRHSSKSP